jgi:sugar lactone lactonase YvrE
VGIVIDDEGSLFVCNCGNGTVRKITVDGKSTEFAKSQLFKCPNGIARDSVGNLYVANFYNGDVLKVTSEAEVRVLATIPGNNNGHVTCYNDHLYVVARSAHQIYRVLCPTIS